MPLPILRTVKNSELTHEEMDNNWIYLDKKIWIDTVNPTESNDTSESFVTNKTLWFNILTSTFFKITDDTLHNAVWEAVSMGGGAGAESFLQLLDTPNSYGSNKALMTSDDASYVEMVDVSEAMFINMYDTPDDYQAGKFVRVSDDGTSLVYEDKPKPSIQVELSESVAKGKVVQYTDDGRVERIISDQLSQSFPISTNTSKAFVDVNFAGVDYQYDPFYSDKIISIGTNASSQLLLRVGRLVSGELTYTNQPQLVGLYHANSCYVSATMSPDEPNTFFILHNSGVSTIKVNNDDTFSLLASSLPSLTRLSYQYNGKGGRADFTKIWWTSDQYLVKHNEGISVVEYNRLTYQFTELSRYTTDRRSHVWIDPHVEGRYIAVNSIANIVVGTISNGVLVNTGTTPLATIQESTPSVAFSEAYEGHFAIWYTKFNSGAKAYVSLGTITNNSITLGSAVATNVYDSYMQDIVSFASNPQEYYVTHTPAIDTLKIYAISFVDESTTVSSYSEKYSVSPPSFPVDNTKIRKRGINFLTYSIYGEVLFGLGGGFDNRLNKERVIGITQDDGLTGDVVDVSSFSHISIGHVGLTTGELCYYDANGDISNDDTGNLIGIAISETECFLIRHLDKLYYSKDEVDEKIGRLPSSVPTSITELDVETPTSTTISADTSPDFDTGSLFEYTVTGDLQILNPTNPTAGKSGVIMIIQDAVGGRNITFGSSYKFSGGVSPTITLTANSVCLVSFYNASDNTLKCGFIEDVK